MQPRSPTAVRTLLLLALALPALLARPARADDEGGGEEGGIAPSQLPGSDSPESTAAIRRLHSSWRGGRKKIQTFLVPMDEKARTPTARVAQALEQLQGSLSHYEVVDLGRALKVDATPAQLKLAAEARQELADANLMAAGRRYREAGQKYRAALGEMQNALPAVDVREYAEAWARLGVVEGLDGDPNAARAAFVNAARHDPEQKVQGRAIDPSAEARLMAARADVEALPMGTLEIEARPAGARVLIDGEQRGHAPLRLELTAGRHLVRVERAGYFPSAELFDVQPGQEQTYSASLKSTPRAADLYDVMAAAAEEAGRGQVGASTSKLADKFGLERMFVGSVSSHGSKVSLTLALVDVVAQKQIGKAALLLAADGTDADQIEEETRSAARKLAVQDPGDPAPAGAAQAGAASPAPAAAAAPAGPAAAAPAPQGGRAVAVPTEELDLAQRERRPVAAAAPAAAQQPEAAPTPEKKAEKKDDKKGKKKKKLKDVTGTEGWGEE